MLVLLCIPVQTGFEALVIAVTRALLFNPVIFAAPSKPEARRFFNISFDQHLFPIPEKQPTLLQQQDVMLLKNQSQSM